MTAISKKIQPLLILVFFGQGYFALLLASEPIAITKPIFRNGYQRGMFLAVIHPVHQTFG